MGLVAFCLFGGYVLAIDVPDNNRLVTIESSTFNQAPAKDFIEMQDGEMMIVENGFKRIMATDMVMTNGTVVRTDGTYKPRNSSKKQMKDGDKMDMDGTMLQGR
jgi:hypothetical protein